MMSESSNIEQSPVRDYSDREKFKSCGRRAEVTERRIRVFESAVPQVSYLRAVIVDLWLDAVVVSSVSKRNHLCFKLVIDYFQASF